MLFSSLTFIFYFLVSVLFFYYIIPKKFRFLKNLVLLIFSLIFYAWGEPKYIILMLLTVLISYICGILINYLDNKKEYGLKKITFIATIILILTSLLYFKYTNFFFTNINNLFKLQLSFKDVILPIGISFYTFQILSYVIDLYRKRIKVQRNFFNLALYISFFPQLIAGPIVTYETIEKQLKERSETFEKFGEGLERFIGGLGKKVIIANQMAIIADAVFNSTMLGSLSSIILIIGAISYTFQIYFDFSGYSDMAIGLGKMFGFEFLENFNYPYMAKSVGDFWKRWHISLTTFFREYVYIPLGGNKVSKKRWFLNMLIVWLLTGLWHGAAWTFIIWGLYYFVFLILERTIFKEKLDKVPIIIRFIVTFIVVNIGWIIFRANSLSDLFIILKGLFDINNEISLTAFISSNPSIIYAIPHMLFAIIFSIDIVPRLDKRFANSIIYYILKKIALLGILVLVICSLVSSLYNPFIYFRF